MKTLIKGGSILTMNSEMEVIEAGAILLVDDKIERLYAPGETLPEVDLVIDAEDCIVMPGLINTHTHLAMTYFRGLADDLPLDIWLNRYIWPLEAKLINREFVYDATLHAACEMIQSGIVLANDMYFEMSAIADACTDAGMRVIVSEAMIDAKPGSTRPLESIGQTLLEHRSRYAANPLVDFSLAPHAIYTCDRQTLQRTAELAREEGLLVHMHLSEASFEREHCKGICGMKPVEYLQELGVLDARCIFAHGVWVDEEEMKILAAHGSSIALCTDSNLKLASGIAPIKAYLEAGVNLSLATDGVASNNNLDLLAEMDITAKVHKAINNDPAFLKAEEMVRMVTIGAAKALGLDGSMGSLEVGKNADIIVISTADLQAQPLYNPYSHLVYALSSRAVRDVLIAGQVVLRNHLLTRHDASHLIRKAKQYKSMILKEL